MEPFSTIRINDVWHVVVDGNRQPCTCREHAETLSQIPVQVSRVANTVSNGPDRDVVAEILKLTPSYHINCHAVRKLKAWFNRSA